MTGQPESYSGQVTADEAGQRLDVYLAARLRDVSRSQVRALLLANGATVNGAVGKPATKLRGGDTVRVVGPLPVLPGALLVPEEIPLSVVYEDENLVVLDKPAGMVVHPSVGHSTGTLVHALLARYPELREEGSQRPGIVHRLDKDTSGLMLVARDLTTLHYLQDLLRERRVLKEYTLLCCGGLEPLQGRIEAPVARDPANRLRMAVVSHGRAAATEYHTVARLASHTVARARLETGRTHQIRVHFAAIGRPLAGDALYGRCTAPLLERQFLHSSRLGLTLPGDEYKEWRSPLPHDLQDCLRVLGLNPQELDEAEEGP